MNKASESRSSKHFAEKTKMYSIKRMKYAAGVRKTALSVAAAAVLTAGIIIPFAVKNSKTESVNDRQTELLEEISYTDARIVEAQNLAAAAVANKAMSENIEIPIVAYSLKVDGKNVAILGSDEEIRKVLSEMMKNSVKDYDDAEAEFVEKVEILEGMHTQDEIISSDELKACLSAKSEVSETYTVKSGDTKKSIAKYYGISVESLEKLNPNIKVQKIKTGDKLNIVSSKKPISVKVTVTETKTSEIKFNKKTIEDDTLSTSYKKITTEGVNGLKETTAKITYIDGRKAVEEIISEEVITEAVDEITTVGTNDNPGASLGKFSWPLPEFTTITSEFGPRWGTNHNGIDISGSGVYGADIVASDGGEIILAQEDDSGYGKHIIIDHRNGYQTQYAHCSELYVSVGDKVNAGQKIGAVGSTGNSTGPHLHFEIIKDGTKVDPLPYLE